MIFVSVPVDDQERAARGVPFDFPPTELPGGTQAIFRDPDGNGLVLSQRR
jgi:hypothetical protein